ncbi:hypothetical protein [Ottowia sp. VDI28]|uniref:hypothetical protein n=1 Tax=Ottowia sp. VDI28 TaxID=3133968 RepID=UPI003C2D364C
MTNDPSTKPAKVTHKGLRHAYAGLKDADFFAHIDDCGGWPLAYPYVGFAHSEKREAAFTMEHVHNGWWTTLYHRDDYLMWKLSPEAWERIFAAVRDDIAARTKCLAHPKYGPSVKGRLSGAPTALHPEFRAAAVRDILKRSEKF